MSAVRDPLTALECVALCEEYVLSLRHDLRNKLASIRNATFYLARRAQKTQLWGDDPNVEQLFKIIDESAQGVDELLQNNAYPGASGVRRPRRVPASEPLGLAVESARVSSGLTIELSVESVELCCDPDEVALALRCLIENGAEAMGQRGVLRVEGGPGEGGDFVVTVTDEGPGIDPARRDDIFAPLSSTKAGHIGLGLNVARRIARRYGGDVSVMPSGRGASVALTLPRDPPPGPGGGP